MVTHLLEEKTPFCMYTPLKFLKLFSLIFMPMKDFILPLSNYECPFLQTFDVVINLNKLNIYNFFNFNYLPNLFIYFLGKCG